MPRPARSGVAAAAAAVLLVLALAAAGPALAQTKPAGAEVDLTRVERPSTLVAEKVFGLKVHLSNHGSERRDVYLFTALYEWRPGTPCGSAADAAFRGFAHLVQPRVALGPGEATTYPPPGLDWTSREERWHHRVNESMAGGGGKMELCVFAATTEAAQASTLTFLDYANFTVLVRPANGAPTASFTFTPSLPNATMPVRFAATASDPDGDPVTLEWDFGRFTHEGRARATGATATHAFYPEGTYTVTLTARDPWDSTVVTREVRVLPEDVPAELPPASGPERGKWPVPGAGAAAAAFVALAVALARSRR